MIKLIATDCDETLLSSDRTIHERNKKAIKKAQDMGIKVIIATGRGPYQLFNILEEIDIEKEDRYSVLCNGGLIMDNMSKKIVDSSPIKYDKVMEISDYCKNLGIHFEIYTDKHCIISPNGNKIFGNYDGDIYKFVEDPKKEDFIKDEIIIKVLLKNHNLNYLMSLEEDIARICDWDVSISYSSDIYMEINRKNVNKANAIKKICKHYGISMNEVLSIGDNYNDKEMLEEAGYSAAVQNAHLLLKDVSKYTTKANNNEGAVGEAIEKFVFDKKQQK
ncbi:Cof-type HAD-IIB family hydrolase [Anaerococcus porci]|uniref:Cof-type HAD-IIB family hydrolase n=1 Tax=Anaerococcus porci TaxID=2652269 RepID=UPI002A752FBE|nr:Cof-type HAD-IIB family hydrolase [Anaerococcus porci]MDY3006618.1 Cof-type HAD-IIB family hydrolase [Anaerococcus porci]